jgi:hypothetical protein
MLDLARSEPSARLLRPPLHRAAFRSAGAIDADPPETPAHSSSPSSAFSPSCARSPKAQLRGRLVPERRSRPARCDGTIASRALRSRGRPRRDDRSGPEVGRCRREAIARGCRRPRAGRLVHRRAEVAIHQPRPDDSGRGEPAIRCPKAAVQRMTSDSRASACASWWLCSRPPGKAAKCRRNHGR